MIDLQSIDFEYPKSDFRLRFEKLSFSGGTKTAIIGPSGFGKTTLLNLISGIHIPQSGTVLIDKTNVNSLKDQERRTFRLLNIGFIFQDFRLLEYLKIADNVQLPFRINGALRKSKNIGDKTRALATAMDIEDKLSKFPNKLSQGERQRVAICRALINDPKVILADEPTGNLDPENKTKIMKLLFDYVEQKGSTLITVTHDHELLSGFDRVVDFKDLYKN
jgi:putative ABC transport system ATP-binding protein